MKRYLFLTLFIFSLTACVNLQGREDYIPIGPQNLSVKVKEGKDIPVFTDVMQIKRPWGNIGIHRIKDLPNDQKIIENKILHMQNFAASHGADALLIKQYFDEESNNKRPVTLATNLVKYLDDLNEEDTQKINQFAKIAALRSDYNDSKEN